MSKVNIQLTPYNSMTILAFLREWVNDDTKGDYHFQAIREAVQEYEDSLVKNITQKQIDECNQENAINQMIGKSPKR